MRSTFTSARTASRSAKATPTLAPESRQELGGAALVDRAAGDPRDRRDEPRLQRGQGNDVGERESAPQRCPRTRRRSRGSAWSRAPPAPRARPWRRASSARLASGRLRKRSDGEIVDAPALVRAKRAVDAPRHVRRDAQRRDVPVAQPGARRRSWRRSRARPARRTGASPRRRPRGSSADCVQARALGLERDRSGSRRRRAAARCGARASLPCRRARGRRGPRRPRRRPRSPWRRRPPGRAPCARSSSGERLERAAAVVRPRRAATPPARRACRGSTSHPPVALVVVPAAAPRLRRDVPELGHLGAEERVDQRRLAGPAPAHEHQRGRPLLEHHRAQRGDPRCGGPLPPRPAGDRAALRGARSRARASSGGRPGADAISGWAFVRLRPRAARRAGASPSLVRRAISSLMIASAS